MFWQGLASQKPFFQTILKNENHPKNLKKRLPSLASLPEHFKPHKHKNYH
jgi:hypothetical protein